MIVLCHDFCSPSPSRCVQPLRRGCHINGIAGIFPSSLFKFGNFRINIASFMPRARSALSFLTIFAQSQSMTWFSFTLNENYRIHSVTVISCLCDCHFSVSCIHSCFTDFLCSDRCSLTRRRTFSFRFVSIIYFLSQPLYSMVYHK